MILGVFTVDFRIRELYMFFKRLASVSERLGELREHSFFCRVSGTVMCHFFEIYFTYTFLEGTIKHYYETLIQVIFSCFL